MKLVTLATFGKIALVGALALASRQVLAQSVEQCELNGKRLPANFSASMIAGESGIVRCHRAGKLSLEVEIRDGKWAGPRTVYHSGGGRTEETLDEDGRRNGVQRDYYENGGLRAERTLRNNAIKVGREHTYYPSGTPESIAFYDEGFQESINYGPTGCISAVQCQPQGSRLPETREICGFGSAPIETRLCDAVETYANGVRIRSIRYAERDPRQIRSQMVIEGGVMKFKSYYPDHKVEFESEEAVDTAGNASKPPRSVVKEYDRRGQLRRHEKKDGDLDTQDWWNEAGRKTREVRSARARKDGLDVVVVTTRTFDAQGRLLSENRLHKLAAAATSGQRSSAAQSPAPAQGRVRYRAVVECIDAREKTFFTLERCPASRAGGAVRRVKREPRSTPANWADIRERWEITEQQLLAYESDCAKGSQPVCDTLEYMRYETPAKLDLKGRDAEKKCVKGDKFACHFLVAREEALADLLDRCEAGDKDMCRRLSNLAQ